LVEKVVLETKVTVLVVRVEVADQVVVETA
jgi:hypothetical protein